LAFEAKQTICVGDTVSRALDWLGQCGFLEPNAVPPSALVLQDGLDRFAASLDFILGNERHAKNLRCVGDLHTLA
jgi:hypothetical protein